MSLLVSPNSPPAQASSTANAGNASQQQADAGNFGQLLNRTLGNQEQPADKASDGASGGVKPAAPGAARRPADADKERASPDDASLPVLAFMPQPSAAVNPLAAKAGLSGDSQAPSAAEQQLNAAIAAAGGKSAIPAAPAQAATEPGDPHPLSATPAAVAMEALTPANGAAPARTAPAGKEAAADAFTAIAHGAEQPLKQAAVGDNSGQQTSAGDGRSDKHEKTEKLEKSDSRGNSEFAPRHTESVAATGAGAGQTATAAAGASRLAPDAPVQLNPVLANGHAAANASISNTAQPEPPKLMLTPIVGSDSWAPALGKQMVWLGNSGGQTAELHLNPPDLGPLKVTLTLNDNQAQAMFVSAHQSVRSALEAALPQLRNSLAESGISLGHTSVSADTQQQQQQSAFAQNQNGQQGSSGHFQRHIVVPDRSPLMERSAVAAALSKNGNGKVDIFA
ncbi:flagellar hook-length control protein FliK [Collimonas sp.]|uniref:flagellar hook-length control protein FliK n=1 Tax=Collimonas sp. TaxID=1963772 RepID=UPI002CC5A3C1|nr:flagellar hook-length control protein FliK [Collimonas sp.]HWX01661.1 flagellar hook-length control protein FliK [Collimonas sp.]